MTTTDESNWSTAWKHYRLPHDCMMSWRQRYIAGQGLLVEDIVLESVPLSLEDRGIEKLYRR